ncbi:hypothetical protein EMIT0215P_20401 [Pseudomonas serboccidentalis]
MTGDAGTEKTGLQGRFFCVWDLPSGSDKTCNIPIIPTPRPNLDWFLPPSRTQDDDRSVVIVLIKKNQWL